MARRLTSGRSRLSLVLAASLAFAAGCADEEPAFEPEVIPAAVQLEVETTGITDISCAELNDEVFVETLPELGGTVDCVGVLHGDTVDLLVTIAPAVEGDIAVAADVLTPLFDVEAAASAAATRLDIELGGAPEIDCPERLVVIDPGRRIECRVTAAGGTAGPVDRPVTIVIVDADANWELELFS